MASGFITGMEYFNTFAGNPVSCAMGIAVLDVIEAEQLQAHALIVGQHLLQGLRALKARQPLIGDVRGVGLFIGVELVLDHATLEPASEEATLVVEYMKVNHRILLSTDGPFDNVLKLKPPMPFSLENGTEFLLRLEEALQSLSRTQP